MNKLKYVILDFGKVIAGPTTGHWFMTPKFLELVDREISNEEFLEAMKDNQEYLDAVMKTEEEEYDFFIKFYDGILKELGYSKSLVIAKEIAYDFVYTSNKYTFYDGIDGELEDLSKRYCLLMLTDNWPCVFRILKERKLDKYFDKIYVSSVYGEKKENGKFFDFLIEDYMIKEGETLFIDDTEKLLDVAVSKGLMVRQMDRERVVDSSKYQIIHDLKGLF